MHLVVGSSSQLAKSFPDEGYVKISSRNIDYGYLRANDWESVYITFSEQRIYDEGIDYLTPNFIETMRVISSVLERSERIVCYGSCFLWNELEGKISIDTPTSFHPPTHPYCISKLRLWQTIRDMRMVDEKRWGKVIMLHPFYFNSVVRSPYFLFGKIFRSILRGERVEVGSLDFWRDMVSAEFVVGRSIEAQNDMMIGAGRLFNVRKFVADLYEMNGMQMEDFVVENGAVGEKKKRREIMAEVGWEYSYERLLEETQRDIERVKEKQ